MAQCSITNCTDLVNCLNNAKQGSAGKEFIELGAGLFEAAGELAGALLLSSLTVTQLDSETALIQERPPCVWIVGKAVLFPGATKEIEYRVEISAEVLGAEVLLLLDATPLNPAAWSFAANFPEFPEYFGFVQPVLKWLPSFYNDIRINEPHFWVATGEQSLHPPGLSLTGLVDLTKGSLASLGGRFPNSSKISLHGPITLRSNKYPQLDLTGDVVNYSIPLVVNVALKFGVIDAGLEPAASTLLLVGSTQVGNFPTIKLSAPILQGDFAWVIAGEVEDKAKYTLSAGLQALVNYVNGQTLPLPSGLDILGFFLDSVTVSIIPELPPKIEMIGLRVASDPQKKWSAPILGLGISDLFVDWQVISPFSTPSLMAMVGGTLFLGSGESASQLLVEVDLSGINTPSEADVAIYAVLDPERPLQLAALFEQFTGIEIDLNLALAEFLFEAHTGARTLQFTAGLAGKWPFPVPLIEFGETNFSFFYTPNSITGTVTIRVAIASFEFFVSAGYAGSGKGWLFAGQLAPDTQGRTLQDFVDSVSNNQYPNLPANLGAISLQRLSVSFNTKTEEFSFDGVLQWPFVFDDFFNLTLEAELSLQSPGPPPNGVRKYSGFVRGSLMINAFSVGVIYSFDIQGNKTLTFIVQYQTLSLTCAFSKDPKTGDRILKANLGGVTFGGIVEYLVNLVDPNLGFQLSAPWDVLNQISFDNLILTVNLTTKSVGVSYKLDKDLGIIYIDTIGLAYVDKAGRKTVDIQITGRFFDQTYQDTNPLKWDLLNDPPPAPPGKAEQFLDLRYLGLGQNVGFRETKDFKRIQDIITAMEDEFLPVESQAGNPLLNKSLSALK
ncbi:MAG TPA: hypothetical protein VKB46_05775, partial [Pyrinomonadaceae bacterium]|nr:hypothetical protein [Pyrinomonadaceae bacterium]